MQSQYFVLLELEDEVLKETDHAIEHIDTAEDIPQISLHAMLGHNSPKTLRIKKN